MSIENLDHRDALDKLKTLVDKIDIGMMCTNTSELGHLHAVPMSRQEVDEEGNLWFLFSSASETYENLQKSNQISVLYSDISNYNFLSINGIAEVSKDKHRIEKYWNKMIEGWFEKGKEDPLIRILKVIPSEGHYWDNKSNKLVTFLKVAATAVSGKKLDIGREGDLNL
ncbi:pyridoxamine 5'-phosphate oxidase family protein [Pedobacter sp. N36a]|uniref:pyridoxamine 5'-phosphate oxidase family protein n=1 Tax=Pedobacter sp. N36a TaxID=2767996 RepID=UPI001656A1DE|nr:pyridoxamine 5'-phosphate oxidase family protein [Pedobacter sp. N36a]MBC8984902.1 pyridoxamine 5'-phosphate oxidase family protein [Pedobacter sp. N36a]